MKKALIICYYWPPAGGPGVQRWLKFVSHLKSFDIDPVVYVPQNPNYPIVDQDLVAQIPKEITVLKRPIKEPYKFAAIFSKKKTQQISSGIISNKKPSALEKLLLYVRGNYFIPDARVGWVTPSVVFLKQYLKDNPVDCIISSGPPHSLHLIGMELQKQVHLPWIADFRDPWTQIGYHKKLKLTALSKRKHDQLESSVLRNSDEIIVTSPQTKVLFSKRTTTQITVITNGYDFEINHSCTLDSMFTLSHVGSLYEGRNPQVLWKVLSDLVQTSKEFSKVFRLNLIGYVSQDVLQSIKSYGLEAHTNCSGYVSHSEALTYQNKTQLLLLIEEDSIETQYIIPGKLFEYMASKRPIISIGPDVSDIEDILSKSCTGTYFRYKDAELLRLGISNHFEAYKMNDLNVDSKGLGYYSRKSLTLELSKILIN